MIAKFNYQQQDFNRYHLDITRDILSAYKLLQKREKKD